MGRQLAAICESLASEALRAQRILFVGWETKVLRRLLDGFLTELASRRKIPTLLFTFARPAAAVRSRLAAGLSSAGDALFIDDSRRHSCDELGHRLRHASSVRSMNSLIATKSVPRAQGRRRACSSCRAAVSPAVAIRRIRTRSAAVASGCGVVAVCAARERYRI